MLYLLQASQGFDILSSLTVYGPLGVWAAIATLGCYFLYKQIQKFQTTERETMVKVIELITKTQMALQTNEEVRKEVNEMIYILKDTRGHWKSMPDIQSKLDTVIKLLEIKH